MHITTSFIAARSTLTPDDQHQIVLKFRYRSFWLSLQHTEEEGYLYVRVTALTAQSPTWCASRFPSAPLPSLVDLSSSSFRRGGPYRVRKMKLTERPTCMGDGMQCVSFLARKNGVAGDGSADVVGCWRRKPSLCVPSLPLTTLTSSKTSLPLGETTRAPPSATQRRSVGPTVVVMTRVQGMHELATRIKVVWGDSLYGLCCFWRWKVCWCHVGADMLPRLALET